MRGIRCCVIYYEQEITCYLKKPTFHNNCNSIHRVGTGRGVNKDYDEVERFFKNPTYEGTSNTNTASTAVAATAVAMYDTVGLPSKQTVMHRATENGHMYEALDKEDENGKIL